MEALATFSLVGLGYLVTKLSKNNEGFQQQQQQQVPVSVLTLSTVHRTINQ